MARFEDLQLLPGTRFQLTLIGSDHRKQQRPALYIGCLPQRTLLLAPAGNASLTLRPGMKLAVSVALPTGLATFASTVESISQVPYPHYHLTLPPEVLVRHVRAAVRVPVGQDVVLYNIEQAGVEEQPVHLMDVSVSGAKLGSQVDLAKLGDRIRLRWRVRVADVERDMQIDGWIRSRPVSDAVNSEFSQVYGVEFGELDSDSKVWLQAFVALQQQRTGAIL